MNAASFFEDFSEGPHAPKRSSEGQGDPLERYEAGYQAGWDDAVKAHLDAQTHLNATLSQNLEQVELTLIEAQTQLLSTIKPVIEEITITLLPGLASEGLRALVVAEIDTLLKSNLPKDVSLIVSPTDEVPVAAFLNSSRVLSEISLVTRDTLSEGQAYISRTAIQRKIDVGQALSEIQKTIESFFKQPELGQADAG